MQNKLILVLITIFLIQPNCNMLRFRNYDEYIEPFKPVINDKNINIISKQYNKIAISWSEATDDKTPSAELKYSVYISATEINSLEEAETAECRLANTRNQTSLIIEGLSRDTQYYITVIVSDNDNLKSMYNVAQARTTISSFQLLNNTSGPTARSSHPSAFANGKLYICGGRSPIISISDMYEYTAATDSWKFLSVANFVGTVREGHSMVTLENKIFILGGRSASATYYDSLYYFDPVDISASRQLNPQGDAPSARAWHNAVEIEGKMYVFAGVYWGGGGEEYLNDLYVYDPALGTDGTWTKLFATGIKPSVRICMAAAVINGKLYFFGGGNLDTDVSGIDIHYNDLYVYDPAANHFDQLKDGSDTSIISSRKGLCAASLNGFMYIFFGVTEITGTYSFYNSVFQYNPKNNSFEEVVDIFGYIPLETGWYSLSTFNNEAYIFGGYNAGFKNILYKYIP